MGEGHYFSLKKVKNVKNVKDVETVRPASLTLLTFSTSLTRQINGKKPEYFTMAENIRLTE